jgi:hypothetical protein
MTSFIEQYKPTTLNQIVGNKTTIQNIFNWINSPSSKLCLIHGPTGIGKTLCVELICNKLNIQPHYIDNTIETFDINIFKSLNLHNPITRKKNYIIIEEIDTISNSTLDEIAQQINNIHIPIICISNTNYIQPIKCISDKITNFKLYPPNLSEIIAFLSPILRENKIILEQKKLIDIINTCKCDVRYILNTIEMLKYGKSTISNNFKDHTSLNMFDVGKEMFNMDNTIEEKYNLFFLEYSLMPLFIYENYVTNTLTSKNELNKLTNISNSSDSLSSCDVIEKMLHENNDWDLEKYIATCSIQATSNCNTKIVQFPEYFKKNRKKNNSNETENILDYYPIGSTVEKLSAKKNKIKPNKAKSVEKKSNNNNQKSTEKKSNNNKPKSNKVKPDEVKDDESSIVCNLLTIPNKLKKRQQPIPLQQPPIQPPTQQPIQPPIQQPTLQPIQQPTLQQQQTQPIQPMQNNIKLHIIDTNNPSSEVKIKNKIVLQAVEIEEEKGMDDNIFKCDCGAIVKKSSKYAHLKSKKHIDLISKK